MLKKVHVVVNIIGGIVDDIDVFAKEKDAMIRYRDLIEVNQAFSRKDIIDIHSDDQEEFDLVWQKDSALYLYDEDADLYYPISTDKHDVYLSEEFIDHDGYDH